MPIRTASFTRRIAANGQALHRAMAARTQAGGGQASEEEAALAEERKALKDERAKRTAQALQPRPSAVDRLVRTHHAQGKGRPKAKHEKSAEAAKPKARRTRAEKHAEQAAAIDAARNSHKKAAGK